MHETIVQFLNMSQFDTWITANPVLFACIVLLMFMAGYFFYPRILYTYQRLVLIRRRWVWWLLRGKNMSKRARDGDRANRLYDWMLDEIKAGRMTHKEKRRFLRNIEMAFELEIGTMTPRPSVQERKRRALGRLSADGANKFVEKVSAAAQPITKRLSSIIAGKA